MFVSSSAEASKKNKSLIRIVSSHLWQRRTVLLGVSLGMFPKVVLEV